MTRTSSPFSLLLAGALLLAPVASAWADDVDKATQDALKSIIQQQIDAFGRDDAATAESFAAPGIKARWPDPREFVDMVKRAYPPLILPRSTHFDATSRYDFGTVQKVTIIDHDGAAWTATYTFEQVDGQWRISGCTLSKEQSTTT